MSSWRSYWSRFLDLVRHSRLEREIDDELQFHLEGEIDAGVRRGLTPQQARREAYDSLGGTPLRMREEIHDVRGLSLADDFRREMRQGLRLWRRSPAIAAVVLATLGIAIGGTVAAFSVTDAWLFRPLRFPAADRLVVAFMATAAAPTEPAVWMPYRTYGAWKARARSFSSVSAAFFQGATWRTASSARLLVGMRVTPEFFATLGVPAWRGRSLLASDAAGPPAIVLSHGFWQRELGGADGAVGAPIVLSDVSYIVVGVMPPDFDMRLLDRPEGAAFWTLLRPGDRGYEPGGNGPVTILARLADGVSVAAARDEAAAIMRDAEQAYPLNFNQPDAAGNQFVVNLSSLQQDNTRTVRTTLLTVLASALCLLLIASTNVGVLLLGQGLGRRNEVAVRHAIGASRARLVRQFLAESLAVSACSGVLGIGIAVAALRAFTAWNPLGTLPAAGVHLDFRAVAAATAAMAVATVVAGLVPAIRLSASGIAAPLRSGEGGRTTAPAQRAQHAMLAGQIAASTLLLVCAALLARTVVQLRGEPLGFISDGIAVAEVTLPSTPFDTSAARNAFYDRLEAQLLARPGVRTVAAATTAPLAGGGLVSVNLTAGNAQAAPRMSSSSVTTGYFDTLDIPTVAGRPFDRRDTAAGRPVVVLNVRAATQLFGDPRSAVGRRVRLGDDTWRDVVGVVGNVRTTFFNTLEWRTDPVVYRPAGQSLAAPADPADTQITLWVHVHADRAMAAAEVRDAAAAAGPRAVVLSWKRVPDMVALATRQPTFRMTLLLWFCGASLLLAAIGVYGVVAQGIAGRVREIAIRIALGAPARRLTMSLVRGALAAGVTGLVIGVGASTLLATTLQSMLYGVRTGDVASVTAAGVLLLIVTGLAAWVPALRATRAASIARLTLGGVLLSVGLPAAQSPDGGLPRRAWLGVALAPHERGAAITAVVDGSSAALEGLRAGDVISAVDRAAVRTPQDVIASMAKHASGDAVSIEIVRGNQPEARSITLRPQPRETLPGVTFEYGSVTVADGSRLRTIVSVPTGRDARGPAVMLLQGGGCGSVDLPMMPDVGQTGLLRRIATQGYVTMRVEKSGLGDSRGPACDSIGYTQELDGYRVALAALKRHPSVNVDDIVLLGISLGGVFAPILANESPVRGIVAYGTLGSAPSPYPGRSERFFREFASADVKGAWSAVSARVLILHGQFDETIAAVDHTQIAPWVNARRPGMAAHAVLEGLDHCWTKHPTMDSGRGRCGQGEQVSALSDAILGFLRTTAQNRAPDSSSGGRRRSG
jgi:predicted permease